MLAASNVAFYGCLVTRSCIKTRFVDVYLWHEACWIPVSSLAEVKRVREIASRLCNVRFRLQGGCQRQFRSHSLGAWPAPRPKIE